MCNDTLCLAVSHYGFIYHVHHPCLLSSYIIIITQIIYMKGKTQTCNCIGGSRGGRAGRMPPTPYGTQFFHFHRHFCQKVPTLEVHAPPNGSTPPTGNPGPATVLCSYYIRTTLFNSFEVIK